MSGMVRKYDLIVPLGYACSCSQTLRRAGLQLASFPWDWVGVPPPSERCRLICDGFRDWMNLEDLKWEGSNDTFGHEEVRNTKTGLIILHDFKQGIPLKEQYADVAEKYARRIARLDKLLRSARNVLLVTIDAPVTPTPTPPEDCMKAIQTMSARYPNARFDFLLLHLDAKRTLAERIDETPLPGIRLISFDYRSHAADAPKYGIEIDALADFLRREYTVNDYRTKEEIKAHKARRREKHRRKLKSTWATVGAKNMVHYLVLRLCGAMKELVNRTTT